MDDALVLARLGLSVVFLVAALAKLHDRPGSRKALVEFGVPERLAGRLHLALPTAELATALALVFASTARLGAVASLALLAVFAAGLTRVLRRGEAPECHCFGQVHSEPASWLTVARNAVLALPAAYVAGAGPGPSLASWADGHDAQQLWLIATSTVAVVATASCVVLWRQNRRLRSTQAWTPPKPLRIGAGAPQFSLPSVEGPLVSLHDLLADGRPCMLTFVAPGCAPCASLLPEIVRWRATFGDRVVLPVVAAGGTDAASALATEHGLAHVLCDDGSAISRAYGVPGTPCAVLVGADGTVKSAPAPGQPAIEALVRVALRGSPTPNAQTHQVA